jgi:hypothetical protein
MPTTSYKGNISSKGIYSSTKVNSFNLNIGSITNTRDINTTLTINLSLYTYRLGYYLSLLLYIGV